jgi:hypothetical protein
MTNCLGKKKKLEVLTVVEILVSAIPGYDTV